MPSGRNAGRASLYTVRMDTSSVATAVGLVKTLKELVSSQGDVVPTEVRAQILALSDQVSKSNWHS